MSIIKTKYGDLLPCSGASDYRKKNRCAVLYYDSGAVRSVYLEEPSELSFPAGAFQAELITFYEDGSAKRIFPLYGQTTAYWSIEEEMENAPYYDFNIAGEVLHIRPQCIYFYPSGKIRSITLWPGDEISVNTPAGIIRTRLGVELYESGKIRSIEPVFGSIIKTPEGVFKHYPCLHVMLHAEKASWVFSEDGKILSEDFVKSLPKV
ncbi:MAG: hypothetical protein IKP14_02855 [Clostridiales bacterium]|nr:hypothetical protein [Clostridiales bacterium]